MKFAFVAKYRSIWSVAWACKVLDISTSGFDDWRWRCCCTQSQPHRHKRVCDFVLYCEGNLVERFSNKLKHDRAITTRYAKSKCDYMAFVTLVSVKLWIK